MPSALPSAVVNESPSPSSVESATQPANRSDEARARARTRMPAVLQAGAPRAPCRSATLRVKRWQADLPGGVSSGHVVGSRASALPYYRIQRFALVSVGV